MFLHLVYHFKQENLTASYKNNTIQSKISHHENRTPDLNIYCPKLRIRVKYLELVLLMYRVFIHILYSL